MCCCGIGRMGAVGVIAPTRLSEGALPPPPPPPIFIIQYHKGIKGEGAKKVLHMQHPKNSKI